ncbi:MAG TPA: acetyl-CoA acetyltransferase [Anaerolineae bacterium]|nr:acetyl-CoA acetyltransferase [Anaerolineae bacterium]
MSRKVAIVGIGYTSFRPLTPEVSYKELMYEAAVKAYHDAGVDPRKDVQSLVTVAEDFYEGTSIFDEYVPDQLGGMLKPNVTIPGDGIHGLATAYMQIASGIVDIAAVEAHSKASNILTLPYITAYAMDPVLNRPLGANPVFVAGMEMNRYLWASGAGREECAQVVAKNKRNALYNPAAAYGALVEAEDLLNDEMIAYPLAASDVSSHADGAIVLVLAAEDAANSLSELPIWIRGIGWCNDAPSLESRAWGRAIYAEEAGRMAYRMAGIRDPMAEIDLAEIDDTYSYKELQHLEALGFCAMGQAAQLTADGATDVGGILPVNVSGGSLGCGHLLDASGLRAVVELVMQLRGEAGPRQITEVETGLAFGWRGVPTTSGAAVVLSN